jgi:RINT-1 / TIP-1 family
VCTHLQAHVTKADFCSNCNCQFLACNVSYTDATACISLSLYVFCVFHNSCTDCILEPSFVRSSTHTHTPYITCVYLSDIERNARTGLAINPIHSVTELYVAKHPCLADSIELQCKNPRALLTVHLAVRCKLTAAVRSAAVKSFHTAFVLHLYRFHYHFEGSRATSREDKPEWMYAFILKCIKAYTHFISRELQQVLSVLQYHCVSTVYWLA